MPSFGPVELIILLLVAMLLFGAKRLPEIGRSLGQSMREFKDTLTTVRYDEPSQLRSSPPATPENEIE